MAAFGMEHHRPGTLTIPASTAHRRVYLQRAHGVPRAHLVGHRRPRYQLGLDHREQPTGPPRRLLDHRRGRNRTFTAEQYWD